ncbi:MAG: hypothetical protein JXA92_08895 [candidate division Zixibacteria bacterium]|nr:hypothetical protein [candidate division Zixibacteria bacterium]
MKTESRRDTFIILSVLIIFAAGYFIVKLLSQDTPRSGRENQNDMATAMGEMKDFPEDYESLVNLGNDFMDRMNYPMAAESYRRALAIDGSSLDVITDYGACLHGMGLVERAKDEFTKVLAQNKEHPIANYDMGIVFYDLEQPDSARYYWEKFLAVEPEGRAAEAIREFLKKLDE